MGVSSKNQVFKTNDLAKDVMFSATGVTDGTLLKVLNWIKIMPILFRRNEVRNINN